MSGAGRERYLVRGIYRHGDEPRDIVDTGPTVTFEKANDIAAAYVTESGWAQAWVEPYWEEAPHA